MSKQGGMKRRGRPRRSAQRAPATSCKQTTISSEPQVNEEGQQQTADAVLHTRRLKRSLRGKVCKYKQGKIRKLKMEFDDISPILDFDQRQILREQTVEEITFDLMQHMDFEITILDDAQDNPPPYDSPKSAAETDEIYYDISVTPVNTQAQNSCQETEATPPLPKHSQRKNVHSPENAPEKKSEPKERPQTDNSQVEVPSSNATKPLGTCSAETTPQYITLRCALCSDSKTYGDKQELHNHIVENHITQEDDKYKLQCGICTTKYYIVPFMSKRSKTLMFRPNQVQKQLCQLVFHQHKQHSVALPSFIQKVPCPVEGCSYFHIQPVMVYEHLRTKAHTDPGYRACPYCGTMIQSGNIQRHVKKACRLRPDSEQTTDKGYTCDHCKKSYVTKTGLQTHMRRVHEENGKFHKEWMCDHCDKSYVTENGLAEHLFQQHKENKRNRKVYSCDSCPFSTLINSGLKKHKLSHNKEDKLFQCSVCEEVFDTIYKFKYHVGKHKGPQNCPHCPYQCDNKNTLSEHIKSKHTQTERYKCELCNFMTGSSTAMWKHKKKHERKKKKIDEMAKNCVEVNMNIDGL